MFLDEFMETSNETMVEFLVNHLNKKSSRESIRGNSLDRVFDVFINEKKPNFKSNSEIIITPLKKKANITSNEEKFYELIDLESIDKKKLFFDDTKPSEMAKIMNHIDDLVEENHLKNSFNQNGDDAMKTTIVYDSDVIPETPIKNYIGNTLLENIRFSPDILDVFEKTPIKTPNKLSSNENDSSLLTPSDQKSSESSFKFIKPTKELVTSSPKQISSFNSKLKKNSIQKSILPDLSQSPIRTNNDVITIGNNEKQESKIKPINFNKRLSMFLRKDAVAESKKEAEIEIVAKKRGLNNLPPKVDESIIIISDDEKSNKSEDTRRKRKISNMPEIIKSIAENANKSFSSEIESFDDSDLDLTYGKDDKNKFNKSKVNKSTVERITPEKSIINIKR